MWLEEQCDACMHCILFTYGHFVFSTRCAGALNARGQLVLKSASTTLSVEKGGMGRPKGKELRFHDFEGETHNILHHKLHSNTSYRSGSCAVLSNHFLSAVSCPLGLPNASYVWLRLVLSVLQAG